MGKQARKRTEDAENAKLLQLFRDQVMEQQIQELKDSGDADLAARKLSMAYLLTTLGNSYAEECLELVAKHHLVRSKIKTVANNLMQSFDVWNKQMASMMSGADSAVSFCNDTMLLGEILDVFMDSHIEVERGPYYKAKLFLPSK